MFGSPKMHRYPEMCTFLMISYDLRVSYEVQSRLNLFRSLDVCRDQEMTRQIADAIRALLIRNVSERLRYLR